MAVASNTYGAGELLKVTVPSLGLGKVVAQVISEKVKQEIKNINVFVH